MQEVIHEALGQSQKVLKNLIENELSLKALEQAANALVSCFKNGGKVYSCGNGGSLCDAMHFAEELSGRFRKNRDPLPALAINDPAHISCTANDFGFEDIYSRFIAAHGREGDLLLAISTSGKSPNILKSVEKAKELKMGIIALVGGSESPLAKMGDYVISTPSDSKYSDRIQELHIKCIHILIELVERQLFPENYTVN